MAGGWDARVKVLMAGRAGAFWEGCKVGTYGEATRVTTILGPFGTRGEEGGAPAW